MENSNLLMQNKKNYIPEEFFYLQWHITEDCNLRCKHCYHESYNNQDELSYEEILEVFVQYKSLLEDFNKDLEPEKMVEGALAFTGGEPFKRPDFMDILEAVSPNIPMLELDILTNGTLITRDIAKRLKEMGFYSIQISIDGPEEIHDKIRGIGAFQKSVNAIKILKEEGIATRISFTAHKENYKYFPDVARLGKEIGAISVGSDRIIPLGSGKDLLSLTPQETLEYFEIMHKAKLEIESQQDNETNIVMKKALQFLVSNGDIYKCGAGNKTLTINSNGDVYPCRRMPVKIGNVREKSLTEIYYTSDFLKQLREPNQVIEGCEKCKYHESCNGGLKCLAYAKKKSTRVADPGCWLAERN